MIAPPRRGALIAAPVGDSDTSEHDDSAPEMYDTAPQTDVC